MQKVRIKNTNNPFFSDFKTKHGAVPFDKIKTKHFLPAVEVSIKEAKVIMKAIKENKEEPNFENTILAFESSADRLDFVELVFEMLSLAESSDEMDRLSEKKIGPMVARFSNYFYTDESLFLKVQYVYKKRKNSNLNYKQIRLVEKYYNGFVRNGALLDEKDKERLKKIDEELSKLSSKFSTNAKKSTNDFKLLVTDKEELSGIPETALELAAHEAKERNKKRGGYLFTLHAPSILPILTYANNRDLRKKILKAQRAISFGGKFDNQKILKKIVTLRHKRANLLGFKTHAEYVLDNRMAKTPKRVWSFLDELLSFTMPAAKKEFKELEKFANKKDGIKKLKAWDTTYYAEKLKKQKFNFDEEELRPYFKLENVIDGVFKTAKKMYGLKFLPVKIPIYHKEVETYEVRDKNNKYVGIFYADFFPRETKKSGAWMTEIKNQKLPNGKVEHPHVGIFCNFTKSAPKKPSLLSLYEVSTFFHEFGHALHGLLASSTYRSLSGTNVLWDFVELPSQLMENWVLEKECLDLFAVHYRTKKKIPQELIGKIKKAQTFMSGMAALRQLRLGYLDMHYHDKNPKNLKNVVVFEQKVFKNTQLLPAVPSTSFSCNFSHIFAGGYSAGYYSYKWAGVLEADAFELFKKHGIFNKKITNSFKENILSRGDTKDPIELWRAFRGREPKIDALLKREGLK